MKCCKYLAKTLGKSLNANIPPQVHGSGYYGY